MGSGRGGVGRLGRRALVMVALVGLVVFSPSAFVPVVSRAAVPGEGPGHSIAETIVLPVADAHAQAADPDGTDGSSPDLEIDAEPHTQAYLKFDVTEASVSTAKLRLFVTVGSPRGFTVQPVRDDGWTEEGITWNTMPPVGPPVATIGSVASGSWVEVDVSGYVTRLDTYSMALFTSFDEGVTFVSREGDADLTPRLVIASGGPDAEAPTAPTGLVATPLSPLAVALSWNPSTDDIGVARYAVLRRGETLVSIPAVEEPAFTDVTVRPGSTYRYRVIAIDRAGRRSPPSGSVVATMPQPGGPLVAAAGDIACDPQDANYNDGAGTASRCRMKDTSDLVRWLGVGAVLVLGDTQYEKGAYDAFLDSYDPTWGRLKSMTHPAVGNHEYRTPGADGYFDYFGEAAGDRDEGYYSFDLGDWHLVVVNSWCGAVGGCEAGSPQERWLRADLAAHPTACTLAYWHHPLFASGYSQGGVEEMRPIWDALFDHGVDVVLNGHEHTYERFGPQDPFGVADPDAGIREFVVGTGGKSLTGFDSVQPNSEVQSVDSFSVLELVLQSDGYAWRFLPIRGGWFTDAGSASCH